MLDMVNFVPVKKRPFFVYQNEQSPLPLSPPPLTRHGRALHAASLSSPLPEGPAGNLHRLLGRRRPSHGGAWRSRAGERYASAPPAMVAAAVLEGRATIVGSYPTVVEYAVRRRRHSPVDVGLHGHRGGGPDVACGAIPAAWPWPGRHPRAWAATWKAPTTR